MLVQILSPHFGEHELNVRRRAVGGYYSREPRLEFAAIAALFRAENARQGAFDGDQLRRYDPLV